VKTPKKKTKLLKSEMKKGKITFSFHFFYKKAYSYGEQKRTLHPSPITKQKTTLHSGKRTLSKQGKLSK